VVAQRDSLVAHGAHNTGDILPTGDGPAGASLQEVAATDGSGVGRVALVDGITQSRQPGIAVDAAMHIILIEDDDALLRLRTGGYDGFPRNRTTAQQHGAEQYQEKVTCSEHLLLAVLLTLVVVGALLAALLATLRLALRTFAAVLDLAFGLLFAARLGLVLLLAAILLLLLVLLLAALLLGLLAIILCCCLSGEAHHCHDHHGAHHHLFHFQIRFCDTLI